MSLVPLLFVLMMSILGVAIGPMVLAALGQALSSERARRLNRWAIGVGLAAVYKPVLTFNSSSDLTLKQRQYDEKHDREYLSFGGLTSSVKRGLFDRLDRYHSFYGTPFAFVDESFGVPVDPRDVDVGHALRVSQEHSSYEHRVIDGETMHESVRAVFERPTGYLGVRLSEVSTLYGGSLDSKTLDKVRDFYQASQAPKDNTSGILKLMIPIGAFVAVLLGGMFLGGSGGGGAPDPTSGNDTTIEFGFLLFAASLQHARELNWRDIAVGGILLAITAALGTVLFLAFPAVTPILGIPLPLGVWCLLGFVLGVAVPPFVTKAFGRSLGPLGMALGKIYIIIGFMGFDRPVITYDDGRYHVVEYDHDEFEVEPTWYRFAMSRVGVAFDNVPENWPDGTTLSPAKVREYGEHGEQTHAPPGMVRNDSISVGSIKGMLPTDVDDDATYVRTDRTTGWLNEAGQDRRLMQSAIETAKQDFGGGDQPVSDKWIVGATVVSMGLGALVLVI